MKYEIVILATKSNIPVLELSYPLIKQYFDSMRIVIIASSELKNEIISRWGEDVFFNEDSIFDGLTHRKIEDILAKQGYEKRAGWYLQQFLKMSYCFISQYDYYLVWDADTIPLNKIQYFDDNDRPAFIVKSEHHKAYFRTIERLFYGKIKRIDPECSYIAENMMINTETMKQMITEISNNRMLKGDAFYEKIIDAVEAKDLLRGFSEFETFGNYVDTKKPGLYRKMKVRSLRNASYLFGSNPDIKQLEWAAKDYDIITIESYGKQRLKNVTKHDWVRKIIRARTIMSIADMAGRLITKNVTDEV